MAQFDVAAKQVDSRRSLPVPPQSDKHPTVAAMSTIVSAAGLFNQFFPPASHQGQLFFVSRIGRKFFSE